MYDGYDFKDKAVNEPPYLENYHSDFTQLGFYYREYKRSGEAAYWICEEDQFGYCSIHLIQINLFTLKIWYEVSGFDTMVEKFVTYWNHEYFHMIGITEEGMDAIRKMGMDV